MDAPKSTFVDMLEARELLDKVKALTEQQHGIWQAGYEAGAKDALAQHAYDEAKAKHEAMCEQARSFSLEEPQFLEVPPSTTGNPYAV